MKREKIEIPLNMHSFLIFVNYFELKNNEDYCFIFQASEKATPTYKYSQQAINLIVEEIKKDPENIIQNLKNRIEKRNKER